MRDLEEQNIMVEGKDYIFVFSADYINNKFFVNVYDKEQKETIVEDHEIDWNRKADILSKINKKPGTVFKHGGLKYLVRNHDICTWNDEYEFRGRATRNIISDDSVYDTRYTADIPLLSRIIIFLKRTWLSI